MSKESGVPDQEPSQPSRTQSRGVYPSRPGSSPGRGLRCTPAFPLPRPCSLSFVEWGTSWAPTPTWQTTALFSVWKEPINYAADPNPSALRIEF